MIALTALLPYLGLILAALGGYGWLKEFRSEVTHIRTNALPHIEDEIKGLRADMRTYFAPAAPTSVIVSPIVAAGSVTQRTEEHAHA